MNRFITQHTDKFLITVIGGGAAVEIADKQIGIEAHLQGDDARAFLEELENMQMAYQNPQTAWYRATWNECLAQVSGEILEAANPAYAEWRQAGLAAGWKVVENDPSEPRNRDRPCLLHEERERAWPLGDWEGAVRDLGYSSPQEVFEEKGASLEPA